MVIPDTLADWNLSQSLSDLVAEGGLVPSSVDRPGASDQPDDATIQHPANEAGAINTTMRSERDNLGEVLVPAKALWGAQTQRALLNFHISSEHMPSPLLMALARIKRAAAWVNNELGLLDTPRAEAIVQAAGEVLAGAHGEAFPLTVWQSGSGTQTHMNMNEVLAYMASKRLGGRPVHPNDHVNLGQSTNDVFPSAMQLAAVAGISRQLLPTLRELRATLAEKSAAFADIVKVGRTHLQDAAPLTLGQEMSGWVAQLDHAEDAITFGLESLHELALGGTAVGTGLNTHPSFGVLVTARLATETGFPFRVTSNPFAAMAAHDPLVHAHGALRTLAVALMKIADDVRWLASGPRCGLGELHLPANEPGSSIMPGKINPTQAEAATMVACQVMGNDAAIGFAASQGNFELNVFKPVIIHNLLQSVTLLADVISSFTSHCVAGIAPNIPVIERHLKDSLMLVTALAPHIGYDNAARIAKKALQDGMTLKEAAAELGLVQPGQFDEWVNPENMILGRK